MRISLTRIFHQDPGISRKNFCSGCSNGQKAMSFIGLQHVWAARAKRVRLKPDSGAGTVFTCLGLSQDTEFKMKMAKTQRPDGIFGLIILSATLALTGFQSADALADGYGYGHHSYGGHHGGHHYNGYSYPLPGLILGYALSNNTHYSGNSYNYSGKDCRKVHKYRYDSYGGKTKISGTMCYDDYGNQYVVPGSRYVDNGYESDYMD